MMQSPQPHFISSMRFRRRLGITAVTRGDVILPMTLRDRSNIGSSVSKPEGSWP